MSTFVDVSEYYVNVAAKYLAVNVAVTGVLRKEALNEIRNAFAHVARGNLLPEADRKPELEKAIGHLQRVALDSAKDTIFELNRRCDKALGVIEVGNLVLPGSVHSGLGALIRKRTKLTEVETSSPPTFELVDSYGKLMEEFYEFFQGLDKEYGIETVAKRIKRKKIMVWFGMFTSFALGISASYIANHIPALWDPKDTTVSEQ